MRLFNVVYRELRIWIWNCWQRQTAAHQGALRICAQVVMQYRVPAAADAMRVQVALLFYHYLPSRDARLSVALKLIDNSHLLHLSRFQ